jgi:hypothetical protein
MRYNILKDQTDYGIIDVKEDVSWKMMCGPNILP